jgi:hypothetical protein
MLRQPRLPEGVRSRCGICCGKETFLLDRIWKAGFSAVLTMLLSGVTWSSSQVSAPDRTVWDGVYFHAQADRGEVNFFNNCVECHDGSGDGTILSSEEFFNRWREERLSALFTFIKTRMPQDNPGSLTDGEYLDLLTYILKINEFPAGDTDLLPPALSRVMIVGVDGPKPLPEGTSVYFVGCLNQTGSAWTLTSATLPSRSRTLRETEQAFKTLETQPLGSNMVYLQGTFDAAGKSGARAYARGLLTYRGGNTVIDVSNLRVLTPQCKQ